MHKCDYAVVIFAMMTGNHLYMTTIPFSQVNLIGFVLSPYV